MNNRLENENRRAEKKESSMTAGQGFVKMIGPVGSAIFLIVFILFLVYCFTGGFGA